MIWWIYNLLFPLGFLLMLPRFLLRMKRRGGYSRNFSQRFGCYAPEIRAAFQTGEAPVWVHAVSVGEIFVALGFMNELRRRVPSIRFVLSTNTSTGYALAEKKLLAPDILIYFPLDFPWVVRRVLNTLRPKALVLTECELWPNLMRQAAKRSIPTMLINGRISEHSFRGYKKLKPFVRRLLPMIGFFCVQSEPDRERLEYLGAPPSRLKVVGSAKYDQAQPNPAAAQLARELLKVISVPEDALILVGGSTWPGEEEILLTTYRAMKPKYPNLLLVLVPRHAERGGAIETLIRARGLTLVRRSTLSRGGAGMAQPDVFLVDSTGELQSFYAVASVIFVGKSLSQHGGQNIIEPALCAKPVMVGPHLENFAAIEADFKEAQAFVQVPDAQAFAQQLDVLLQDGAQRQRLGAAALALVQKKAGASRETVDIFLKTAKVV